MKERTLIATLLFVTIMVVAAIAGGVMMTQATEGDEGGNAYGIPVKTTTRAFCRDVGGVGGWETGEVFDGDDYRMAWTDSGKTERIPVSAAVHACQTITTAHARLARYIFYISTPRSDDYTDTPYTVGGEGGDAAAYGGERDGRKWDLFKFPTDAGDFNEGEWRQVCRVGASFDIWLCDPQSVAKTPMAAPIPFKIEGRKYLDNENTEKYIYDGSVLRVEYQQFMAGPGSGWETLLVDEARIRSAVPDAQFDQDEYKVGETARLRFDLPSLTIGGDEAYYLSVLDLNAMSAVKDSSGSILYRTPFSSLTSSPTGVVNIPVTSDMFADKEPCTNALQARIYSPILEVDEDETSVLPEAALSPGAQPTVTAVTFDKEQYNKGDSIQVTASATGNVSKWTMDGTIEGLEALPLTTYRQATNVLVVSFTLPAAGLLKVHTRAYNVCLPSATKEVRLDIGRQFGPFCFRNPSDPLCTKDKGAIPMWVIMLIAAVVGLLIGILVFLAGIKVGLRRLEALVLAVVVGAIVAILVYMLLAAIIAALKGGGWP